MPQGLTKPASSWRGVVHVGSPGEANTTTAITGARMTSPAVTAAAIGRYRRNNTASSPHTARIASSGANGKTPIAMFDEIFRRKNPGRTTASGSPGRAPSSRARGTDSATPARRLGGADRDGTENRNLEKHDGGRKRAPKRRLRQADAGRPQMCARAAASTYIGQRGVRKADQPANRGGEPGRPRTVPGAAPGMHQGGGEDGFRQGSGSISMTAGVPCQAEPHRLRPSPLSIDDMKK